MEQHIRNADDSRLFHRTGHPRCVWRLRIWRSQYVCRALFTVEFGTHAAIERLGRTLPRLSIPRLGLGESLPQQHIPRCVVHPQHRTLP